MYQYLWDAETGGLLLTSEISKFSKEPRPVYYRELDILGFDAHWSYPRDDSAPIMWAEANNYIYRGRKIASTKGGSLYTKPELIIIEESPEPNGAPLIPVDVAEMCRRNADLMETLVQETIQKIYNTYMKYRDRIDVFYVAFSGGKDSVVTLDLVQRALPHDQFIVVFSDTGMEFSDTYKIVDRMKKACESQDIGFYISHSSYSPQETWSAFGPPCTVTRWCCSVHKTAPQILLLRELTGIVDFHGMAYVGVRGDESVARSKYEYIAYEGKHKGQYSCNAIWDWGSAEIFIYTYAEHLMLNETYKKGNRRAGCLICPRAAERNDYMSFVCYQEQTKPLIRQIELAYERAIPDSQRLRQFIENGGWKARKNGRDINIRLPYREVVDREHAVHIRVLKNADTWRTWIKTIGIIVKDDNPVTIDFQGEMLSFSLEESENELNVTIDGETASEHVAFVKLLKNVFRKTACCIGCRECQADCPFGNMDFINGKVVINDKCHHCALCHKVEKGCLVYKSLEEPKGGILMTSKNTSLNSYSHHAPKMDWVRQYFEYKNTFDENHTLGSQMYSFFKRFLRDAGLLNDKGFTSTAELIERIGYDSPAAWGIIFTNLVYTPQVNWYVVNITFGQYYKKELITSMLVDSGAKDTWTGDIFSSLTRLCELPLGNIGFGSADKNRSRCMGITRSAWTNPVPEVILYSLYKFAEACGDYYQFSLSTLMDDSIDRNGISPTRIFGLDRDNMIRLLNGLSGNYPDFISASFTLDLETITLNKGKTSADVLNLF